MNAHELLAKDEVTGVPDAELDDALWLALSRRIRSIDELELLSVPVQTYYASRYVEWEVGNGGFAQAVLNIPEWLEPAACAFENLGKPKVAETIREARQIYEREKSALPEVRPGAEPELSDYFLENAFNYLDDRLDQIHFWSDDMRLAYVRGTSESI